MDVLPDNLKNACQNSQNLRDSSFLFRKMNRDVFEFQMNLCLHLTFQNYKLRKIYELYKSYKLYKLYELYKSYKLYKLYELYKSYKLYKLY